MSAKTARIEAVRALREVHPRCLAVHELPAGYSQNNYATRMSFLRQDGVVFGRARKGEAYFEWGLMPGWEDAARPVPPESRRSRPAPRSEGEVQAVTPLEDGSFILSVRAQGRRLFDVGQRVRIA